MDANESAQSESRQKPRQPSMPIFSRCMIRRTKKATAATAEVANAGRSASSAGQRLTTLEYMHKPKSRAAPYARPSRPPKRPAPSLPSPIARPSGAQTDCPRASAAHGAAQDPVEQAACQLRTARQPPGNPQQPVDSPVRAEDRR